MAANLIIAPEAEQDMNEAYAWYEQQRAGLGEEVLTCFDAAPFRLFAGRRKCTPLSRRIAVAAWCAASLMPFFMSTLTIP